MTDEDNILIRLRRAYAKDEMVSYVIRRIKELKVELGKAYSEIDYLNDKITKMERNRVFNDEMSREARIEAKKEEIYKQNRDEILSLRDKVRRLSKDNSELITKLCNKNG